MFPGFNPRTRVGCDPSVYSSICFMSQFQSTHPRGVRQHRHFLSAVRLVSFNPRTRVGCDFRILYLPDVRRVSIHAPAWGATGSGVFPADRGAVFQSTHPRGVRHLPPSRHRGCRIVSIHAPAWGATSAMNVNWTMTVPGFNPRTRVGCDALDLGRVELEALVSIHAPAWGATVSMFYPVDSRD